MKFRTEIEVAAWSHPIDYNHNIVSLGSCFADNIARILARYKFRITASPTGILFNPASIAEAMEAMLRREAVSHDELIEHEGRYLHHDFHSSLSGATAEEAVATMTRVRECGGDALRSADLLIVTLGTAWVYRLASNGAVVANCHKQPASKFRRELLSVGEIVEALRRILRAAGCRVVFTLSPVRHAGEGLEDNSLSKALLRVAISEVCKESEAASYFPSYEIVMDDLRDYRFYADDLVHPSPAAIEYIAEKFFKAATTPLTQQRMQSVERVVRAAEHRPANPQSEEFRKFCQRELEAIAKLSEIDFSEEKSYFEKMLQINL